MSVHTAPQLPTNPVSRPSLLADVAMPAVRFLTGPDAIDVLRPPVEAAGGRLLSVTPRNVQYRPGSDLIVKYAAEVIWPDRPAKREMIMASARAGALHHGAVPVTATVDGQRAEVGVWRWPFDPVLVGLRTAVTPSKAAELCQIADPRSVTVKVLAFRPTERSVVQVSTPNEVLYLKVVPPHSLPALVHRHRAATAAGVPVPRVRDSFPELGVAVFDELAGPLLKDEIKAGGPIWPRADEFDLLAERLAKIDADLPVVSSRVAHGVLHAEVLRTVDEGCGRHLGRLTEAFGSFDSKVEPQTIHGDLHEGQIVVDGGRIAGVLDLDDLGTGSPLEERANLLGFLRYRAVTLPAHRCRITDYADRLRSASATSYDRDQLDIATAAVLVGLATGPFRIQQSGWRRKVSTLIAHAESHIPAERPHLAAGTRSNNRTHTPPTPPEES